MLGIPEDKSLKLAKAGLRMFRRAHASDWYLNRAMWRVFHGAWWDPSARRPSGKPFIRDSVYYANAALKAVREHRRMAVGVPSLEKRGMMFDDYNEDSRLLLSIREMDSVAEILACMEKLKPFRHE
jgi:hypothetical protein